MVSKHPTKLRNCDHCGCTYTYNFSHSKYCSERVPRDKSHVTWNTRIRFYGVGKKEWDIMYAKVNGICPICNKKKVTDVEHDHETGKVRGLVGTQCNKGLHFLDNKEWMKQANKYLQGEL